MKADVKYNQSENYIYCKITSNDRTLEDIEATAKIIKSFEDAFNTKKIFYDHSEFEWKFDYLNEYKLGKDFQKLLPFENGTKIAFYLGEYFRESYWELMKKLVTENSTIHINYFGDFRKAINWLLEE